MSSAKSAYESSGARGQRATTTQEKSEHQGYQAVAAGERRTAGDRGVNQKRLENSEAP